MVIAAAAAADDDDDGGGDISDGHGDVSDGDGDLSDDDGDVSDGDGDNDGNGDHDEAGASAQLLLAVKKSSWCMCAHCACQYGKQQERQSREHGHVCPMWLLRWKVEHACVLTVLAEKPRTRS